MIQEQIDAIILDFLKAYKAWADEDAPEGGGFERGCGLCTNLDGYAERRGYDRYTVRSTVHHLTTILPSPITPFNAPSRTYTDDTNDMAHHRNPARMAWVNEQIERMEK